MDEIKHSRLGEIVEASTGFFKAQCYKLYALPSFGTLVKTLESNNEIFAVVCQASTMGLEPGRKPIARGQNEQSEESLFHTHPQLSKLLCSEFSALVVGHNNHGSIKHFLPPRPARIHGFVYSCNSEELLSFSHSLGFLSLLVNAELDTPADELITAVLRGLCSSHEDSRSFMVKAGKELAILLGQNYARLKTILEKIRL
ncbi:MAG: hypothetical protein FWH42_03770 [Dehalococcoidia bacterium]|nr:hypothetical protein [Dehalococcoidia bacterium]